ncbi:hypothetical protein E4U09_000597, partial [Claviceps aff. purpurea]
MAETGVSSHASSSAKETPLQVVHPTEGSLPKHVKKFADFISPEWRKYKYGEDIDQRTASTTDINDRIVWAYDYYIEEEKYGFELKRMFAEDFMEWSRETWERATARVRQEMRDLLTKRGIEVGKGTGASVAECLRRMVSDYFESCDDDKGKDHHQHDQETRTDNGESDQKLRKDDLEHATIEQKEQRAQELIQNLEEKMQGLQD